MWQCFGVYGTFVSMPPVARFIWLTMLLVASSNAPARETARFNTIDGRFHLEIPAPKRANCAIDDVGPAHLKEMRVGTAVIHDAGVSGLYPFRTWRVETDRAMPDLGREARFTLRFHDEGARRGRQTCKGGPISVEVTAIHDPKWMPWFNCTPTLVGGGTEPIRCAEGANREIILWGISARDRDGKCRPTSNCPKLPWSRGRDALIKFLQPSSVRQLEDGRTALIGAITMNCRGMGADNEAIIAQCFGRPHGLVIALSWDLACAVLESGAAIERVRITKGIYGCRPRKE